MSLISIPFSAQPQHLFVSLQSKAGSNNKRDKTNLCKHQSHERIFVSETDSFIVHFFFGDKGLKLSLLKQYFFKSFFKLKISMKLEKIQFFILQFDLENPPRN